MGILGWWSALTGSRRAKIDPGLSNATASTTRPPEKWLVETPVFPAEAAGAAWLLDVRLDAEEPLSGAETALLERLSKVLESESGGMHLLPRAARIVPQLLGSLRDERVSLASLSERIAADTMLCAEVLRLANSAYYRTAAQTADITELSQAVLALGSQGLRQAIARHVVLPIFDAPPGSLAARVAPRLMLLGERKARLCSAIASALGLPVFDAYLAGLLHNVGWIALCRTIVVLAAGERVSGAFVDALILRCDHLFGRLVTSWELSPLLTELADTLAQRTAAEPVWPLARALHLANGLASLPLLAVGSIDLQALPASVLKELRTLPPLGGG